METITIDEDISVLYITASSFPEGILEAHQKLHARVLYTTERRYFGISRPENGIIIYKAAAEETEPGEAEKLNCDRLVLERGRYVSLTIKDYMKDIQRIGQTFQQLLASPGLDPNGYCVEWYLNDKDVRCMVRLSQ